MSEACVQVQGIMFVFEKEKLTSVYNVIILRGAFVRFFGIFR